jgi:hypothetical protein
MQRVGCLNIVVATALWAAAMASIVVGGIVWIMAPRGLDGAALWAVDFLAVTPLLFVSTATFAYALLRRALRPSLSANVGAVGGMDAIPRSTS